MSPSLISLDCVGTLVDMRWSPRRALAECEARLGISFGAGAEVRYGELIHRNRNEYLRLQHAQNVVGTGDLTQEIWIEWASKEGFDPSTAVKIARTMDGLLIHPDSPLVELYPDTVPCLKSLRERGCKIAVASNWDLQMVRMLTGFGLAPFFDFYFASLAIGHEKPNASFFDFMLEATEMSPENCWHIGDTYDSDFVGARGAGWNALWLNRNPHGESGPHTIKTLTEGVERIWTN